MKLYIVDSRRRKRTLEIPATDTLLDLKKKFQEASKITPKCQSVSVRKGKKEFLALTTADDNKSLEELALHDGDTIEYEPFRTHIQHVNWNEGQTVTIDLGIHPETTVQEFKALVHEKTNIPIHEQRLVFYDRFLDDPNDTIGANGVEHDDTIEIHDGITLSVLHKKTGKLLFQQAAEPNDSIYTMKHHIQQTCHILVDSQDLFWKGSKLTNNESTLRETGILHGDTLKLNNDMEGMTFKIRLPTSEVFSIMNVNPVTDTIDELKLRIQEVEGIPRRIQYLDFMGTNLTEPEKTLMECRIQKPGDLVDLTPHREKLTPIGEMVLIIREQSGPNRGKGMEKNNSEILCHLTVLPKDTIRDVKKKIQDKTKILMFLQQLSYNGQLLSDDRPTLHYLEIKSNEILDMVKLPLEIQLRVVYEQEGKPDELMAISYLDRMDTLAYVQEQIEKVQGTKVEEQSLWFRGKALTDPEKKNSKETLFDLRIKHKAVVVLKVKDQERIKREREAARLKEAEEEARRQAEEQARLVAEAKARAEEEARRRAEEEARQKAEEEARKKAEEEARLKAEEEARIKAEEEAKRKARRKEEKKKKKKAKEEARRKAEFDARIKAERDARLKLEAAQADCYDRDGLHYKLEIEGWHRSKIHKARKRDYIGLTFIKDSRDGHYYVEAIDDKGWIKTFAPYLRLQARLMKFQDKEPSEYASADEIHEHIKEDMHLKIETVNPKEIHNESDYDYGGNFEKGDIADIDGGPSQVEIMRKVKEGKWMVKNLDTGKPSLIEGVRLTKVV